MSKCSTPFQGTSFLSPSKTMARILPFSIVALTAISSIFCTITVSLAFLNLDLVWVNLLAGVMTVLYHLFIIILAWHRMHKRRIQLDATPTLPVGSEDCSVIPHSTPITGFGLIVLCVWIIAIGITIDVAVQGVDNDSFLTPSSPSRIDQAALIASALINGVETIVIAFFVWCFLKRQKKVDEQERDKLEESIFNPVTPVLTRTGTFGKLKRIYSRRSTQSRRARPSISTTVVPALNHSPIFLKSPKIPITRRNVSPWEMLTPNIPTPTSSPTITRPDITVLPQSPPPAYQWR